MDNKKIANILYDIANLLDIKDIKYESIAYRRAARSIEDESQDLKKLYKMGGTAALMDIDGVGMGIAENIEYMLINNGKSDKLNYLLKDIPKGVLDILRIPGLGPKKVKVLYNKLKIDSKKKLLSMAKKGRIRELDGFAEKTEKMIIDNIDRTKKDQNRISYSDARKIANKVINLLKKLNEVEKIEYMGSLRRKKETVGDIDILVSSNNSEKIVNKFIKLPGVIRVLVSGKTKTSILYEDQIQIDLRIVKIGEFGSASQYFTGSLEHNVIMRKIAISKNMKLSEYGLFDKTGKLIESSSEKKIYKKLGLKFIPPSERVGSKEFDKYRLKKI
jgi:DNA polymerase (family 10)|tara:strand:- start:2773 stop:3765 length:993 start_codon:yes stop_codon:yes gene_type:complete